MKRRSAAVRVAYPALLSALALMLLYLSAIVPSGRWGVVAMAGLLPAAAVISVGLKAGFLCWAGTATLAFLLIPEKLCVLLFSALFGLYPMVKYMIEGLRRRPVEYLLKLLFFNGTFTIICQVMRSAVLDSLPWVFDAVWPLYLAGSAVFLLYDFGFSRVILLYNTRIQRMIS